MDMSKAFDLVKHSLLFTKLMHAGLPLIFLRLLLFVYLKQYANVKWNGSYSNMFSLTNGVRKGESSRQFCIAFMEISFSQNSGVVDMDVT